MLDDKLKINCFLKWLGFEQPAGIERQTNQTPSGNTFLVTVDYFIIIRNNILLREQHQ